MQVIVVKYHPQSGARYARYSATCSSGLRAYVESDPSKNGDENRDAAVRKLCDQLHWRGVLVRGGQLGKTAAGGFVYVWYDPADVLEIEG